MTGRKPFDDFNEEDFACGDAVNQAMHLYYMLQSVQMLGLQTLSVNDFSAYEFELMSYLSSQLAEKRKAMLPK